MYLYLYKNLKRFCTNASKRLTLAPLNKISLTLSHKSVLSVTTITISVLSLTSTPLSAVAQSVQGSQHPGSAVLWSSSVSWNGSVGRHSFYASHSTPFKQYMKCICIHEECACVRACVTVPRCVCVCPGVYVCHSVCVWLCHCMCVRDSFNCCVWYFNCFNYITLWSKTLLLLVLCLL